MTALCQGRQTHQMSLAADTTKRQPPPTSVVSGKYVLPVRTVLHTGGLFVYEGACRVYRQVYT